MLRCEKVVWEIADLGPPSPFPAFPAARADLSVPVQNTLLRSERENLGCGIVPAGGAYPRYELYNRVLEKKELQTVVLENNKLKARFLPSLGGRLISLYAKEPCRELLFRNEHIFFGNLGICDAWFAGGIEWNIGKRGHSCYTASPIFMGTVHTSSSELEETGVRIFDFERETGLFWQFDFFLCRYAALLISRAKIVNPHEYTVPLYSWVNTAVSARKKLRVFSSPENVLFKDNTIKGLGRGKMPAPLPLQGDLSYVRNNLSSANEYFFQPESSGTAWEAVADEKGEIFFDFSSPELPYRKAFIWGEHNGGKNWQAHLSGNESPEYLEIQAGVAPTQFHSTPLEAKQSTGWTQIFGSFTTNPEMLHAEWRKGVAHLEKEIPIALRAINIDALNRELSITANNPPSNILNIGSGWGRLEQERLNMPSLLHSFHFPEEGLTEKQKPWLNLLKGERLPREISQQNGMVQPEWYHLISGSIPASSKGSEGSENEATPEELFHLGLTALAIKDTRKGEKHLLNAYEKKQSIETAWLLMELYRNKNDMSKAIHYGKALTEMSLPQVSQQIMAAAGFLNILWQAQQVKQATQFHKTLSVELQNHEKVAWAYAPFAFANKQFTWLENFFKREFIYIQEGDKTLETLWKNYQNALASSSRSASHATPAATATSHATAHTTPAVAAAAAHSTSESTAHSTSPPTLPDNLDFRVYITEGETP